MLIYAFTASYPNTDLITSVDFYLNDAGKNHTRYKSIGFFKKLNSKGIFIYRIQAQGKVYDGIVAASDLKDIAHKNILGHENTIIEKEQEMLSKMLQRKAMIKPVLLGYPSHAKIDLFIQRFQENNQPFLSLNAKQKNEIHQIWAITSVSDLAEIKEIFKVLVPKAYIADGHHRAKVTSELLEKSFLKDEDTTKHPALLSAFFPMHMLTIFEFNRVVTLPENMSLVQFIIHCSRLAEMQPLDGMSKPSSKYCLHHFIDHKWYVFKWREHILDKYLTQPIILDVDIFNHEILETILGVEDVKTATNITYIPGNQGLNAIVEHCKNGNSVGFAFYPIQNQDVIKVSDHGGVLPPKSTWFEPRMHNGILIKEFNLNN